MKRGDIYNVAIPYNTGHEIAKDRPAVIVGVEANYYETSIVQVVFCTAADKPQLPEYVLVGGLPRPSVAMCSQLYTVDVARVKNYIGAVTPDELHAIEKALRYVLGLSAPPAQVTVPQPPTPDYKQLYEDLLDRVIGRKGA